MNILSKVKESLRAGTMDSETARGLGLNNHTIELWQNMPELVEGEVVSLLLGGMHQRQVDAKLGVPVRTTEKWLKERPEVKAKVTEGLKLKRYKLIKKRLQPYLQGRQTQTAIALKYKVCNQTVGLWVKLVKEWDNKKTIN